MLLLAAHPTTAADGSSGAAVARAPTERIDERQGTAPRLESPRIDATAFAASLEDRWPREHV